MMVQTPLRTPLRSQRLSRRPPLEYLREHPEKSFKQELDNSHALTQGEHTWKHVCVCMFWTAPEMLSDVSGIRDPVCWKLLPPSRAEAGMELCWSCAAAAGSGISGSPSSDPGLWDEPGRDAPDSEFSLLDACDSKHQGDRTIQIRPKEKPFEENHKEQTAIWLQIIFPENLWILILSVWGTTKWGSYCQATDFFFAWLGAACFFSTVGLVLLTAAVEAELEQTAPILAHQLSVRSLPTCNHKTNFPGIRPWAVSVYLSGSPHLISFTLCKN